MEAEKLKSMTVGGIQTKVIAIGIGSLVLLAELHDIASTPANRNVILAHNFTWLSDVQQQLVDAIGIGCSCQCSPVIDISSSYHHIRLLEVVIRNQ